MEIQGGKCNYSRSSIFVSAFWVSLEIGIYMSFLKKRQWKNVKRIEKLSEHRFYSKTWRIMRREICYTIPKRKDKRFPQRGSFCMRYMEERNLERSSHYLQACCYSGWISIDLVRRLLIATKVGEARKY